MFWSVFIKPVGIKTILDPTDCNCTDKKRHIICTYWYILWGTYLGLSSWPSFSLLLTIFLSPISPLRTLHCCSIFSHCLSPLLVKLTFALLVSKTRGKSSQRYVSDLPTEEPQRGHNARGHMITAQTHKKSIKHGGLSAVLLSSWQVLQTGPWGS